MDAVFDDLNWLNIFETLKHTKIGTNSENRELIPSISGRSSRKRFGTQK